MSATFKYSKRAVLRIYDPAGSWIETRVSAPYTAQLGASTTDEILVMFGLKLRDVLPNSVNCFEDVLSRSELSAIGPRTPGAYGADERSEGATTSAERSGALPKARMPRRRPGARSGAEREDTTTKAAV